MRTARALLLVVAAAAVPVLVTGRADAASCAAVKVTGGLNSIALSPTAVSVKVGGCVRFTNTTTAPPPFDTVSITVGSVTHSSVAQGASTTFTESKAGKFTMTAKQSNTPASASGRVTVTAASPTPKPTPTRTATPRPSPTGSPAPLPSQSTGPQVAPTRSTPPRSPSLAPSPSPSNTSFLVGTTTPTPTPSATILSGPLQPASGRGVGLPAALAALFVIGSGGGLLRVLLAEPHAGGPQRPEVTVRNL